MQMFIGICVLIAPLAHARGPSPYLPLDISPSIERQIERVLILAGKPVMRRPIAAAVVLDALPVACERDRALCEDVRRHLQRYMGKYAVTHAQAQVGIASGDSAATMPNQHGKAVDSTWQVAASGYFQPNDYLILNAGGVAYEGEATATGSFLSVGFDFAQLDVGFRDHWLGPMSDSSSLISTQAPTMPSITLSNYRPISPLGFSYEVFHAESSRQDGIRFSEAATTSGRPRLAGVQLGIEPTLGYALSVNRITQYGGGDRNTGGFSQFIDALTESQDPADVSRADGGFGNQVASIASSFIVPGRLPFGVHLEYAGEDNAYAAGYRLGATNLTLGIDFPRLWKAFDANVELSEWQNSWYVHHVYPDGLTNRQHVLGHWFGDQREFGTAIGGDSQMLALGWQRRNDQYFRVTYRTMALDSRWVRNGSVPVYERLHSLGVNFATNWRDYPVELELVGGQDIFGDSFARLAGSFDFSGRAFVQSLVNDVAESGEVEFFIDVGTNRTKVRKLLEIGSPAVSTHDNGMHLAVGARRSVSERGEIGTRLELDQVDGRQLLSLRALDYQYRVTKRLSLSGFAGFARYDYGLATNGYFWGAGVQFRDVLPKWDIGFDARHYEKLNRDKSLPNDPVPTPETHPRLYIDMDGMTLYVTRRW